MFLLNYEILEERGEFFLSCAQGCDIAAVHRMLRKGRRLEHIVLLPLSAMAAKQNASQRRGCGARNQTSVKNEANKNPENKLRFRGLKSNQTRVSLSPSFIQTITVGSGVTPDHASND